MYNGAWNKQVVLAQNSALLLNGQGTTQQRTLQSRTSGSSPPSVCTLLEVLQWPKIYAKSSCQVDPLLSLYSKGKGVRECESTRMREDDSARERCEEPEGERTRIRENENPRERENERTRGRKDWRTRGREDERTREH